MQFLILKIKSKILFKARLLALFYDAKCNAVGNGKLLWENKLILNYRDCVRSQTFGRNLSIKLIYSVSRAILIFILQILQSFTHIYSI